MNVQSKILEVIDYTIKNNIGNKKFVDFAKVTISELVLLRNLTGKDFTGYVHCIDAAGIVHAFKHSNIKSSDILLIPFIVENYDVIGIGKEEGTIVYKKLIGKEYFYIEETRVGRKKLVIKTFYKRKTKKRQKKS
jgi:hypothetical protein